MIDQLLIHRKRLGLIMGPALFLLILFWPVEGMQPEAMRVLAVAALMASWWISEAIPIPATALLPIVLFPLLGVMDAREVTLSYANHLIYLFMGGFLIAVTIEKWNLHRRIALHTIRVIGTTPQRIILGFMLATAGLSMWISNTAATMMMVTIALAVLKQLGCLHDGPRAGFGTGLMLGIAYAASIGGVATLIGTPPNVILAGVLQSQFGIEISFLDWMLFALPLAFTMLLLTWYYLTRITFRTDMQSFPGGAVLIGGQLQALGNLSRQERRVLAVFVAVALLWIGRGLLGERFPAAVQDSTIAMAGAALLFILPSGVKEGDKLLDWQTAVRIPWDILILFGGGFALARGFSDSGLTTEIAAQLQMLQGSSILLVVASVAAVVIFLTEITSNTATASLFLPVMGALAVAMSVHPFGLMVAAAVAATFAFMLPVATPPNAIVFGSRYITIQQMVKTGLWLNLIGLVLITLFIVYLLPLVWGVDISRLPVDLSLSR